MNPEKARKLLEKYWECALSQEEEKQLSDYFINSDLPEDLIAYRSLFVLYKDEQNIRRPENRRKVRYLNSVKYLKQLAAMLIIGLGLWWTFEQFPKTETQVAHSNRIEIKNPEVARQKAKEALLQVSAMLNKQASYNKSIVKVATLGKYVQPKNNKK